MNKTKEQSIYSNEKKHKFVVLRKTGVIIAGILIVFSIACFVKSYYLAKPVFELRKAMPVSMKVDLSKQGVHSGTLEPLLGDLGKLNLDEIDWVIVGGESGPGARPIEIGWVRNIREQCLAQNVPFFFKQWGGINKKKAGRLLDGKTWDEMPIGFRDNMYA